MLYIYIYIYIYIIHICSLFLGCAVCVARYNIISFLRNQEGIKTELQIKVHRRFFVRGITFLTTVLLFVSFFVAFFVYYPSKRWTYLMAPIKIHNIIIRGIWCNVEDMKISCNVILVGWHF